MRLSDIPPRIVRLLDPVQERKQPKSYVRVKRWRARNKAERNAGERARRARNRPTRICPHCGLEFKVPHMLRKYCSQTCRRQAEGRRRNANAEARRNSAVPGQQEAL